MKFNVSEFAEWLLEKGFEQNGDAFSYRDNGARWHVLIENIAITLRVIIDVNGKSYYGMIMLPIDNLSEDIMLRNMKYVHSLAVEEMLKANSLKILSRRS